MARPFQPHAFSLPAFPGRIFHALLQPPANRPPPPRSTPAKATAFKKAGWTYVHLEGTPAQLGFQHGALLSAEIADMVEVIKQENTHETRRDWEFFRNAGRTVLWPHIDPEYRQELEGIARGVQSQGVKLDVWDIVALNGGIEELNEYYRPLAQQAPACRQRAHSAPRGPLLGLHRRRQLHEGRQNRDRPQQLVKLCRGSPLDGHLRHHPATAIAC